MKLATIDHLGTRRLAAADPRGWITSTRQDAALAAVIEGYPIPPFDGPVIPADEATVVLPYRPRTLFGVGLNFHDTVREMQWDVPSKPYLFPKLSSSVIGGGESIVVDPAVTTRADWEGELAVIIGRRCRHVAAADAAEVIFGYTVANDISARDVQADDGQWVRGKGLDTFCPLGPVVVTADEIADPQQVGIRTRLNGTLVQDGTTADMIFGVAELIAYLSTYFTLAPGDVILTGTPSGCGDFRNPPIALTAGDVVEVEIEGIGRLVNPVVAP